ncbi:hypothetical protein [Chryseobacterium aurantiacum]|uniref:hypothetical protein n=1 Tax=Chryseobacterium aurantiacum TaxID=2116499 RepID=UPI000D13E510|nr:hypothetical protein [Chryseobacterium aurantiacum]
MKAILTCILFTCTANTVFSQVNNTRKKIDSVARANPLYHNYRIDELRTGLRYLIRDEPYKSDPTLIQYTSNLKDKLERTNIANYIEELRYFADLKIDKRYKDNFDEEIANINHTASHALADVFLGKKDYGQAEKYFLKALVEHQLFSVSGTTVEKDSHRIEYDLVKVYQNLGRKDEAYGYLLALINSQWNYELGEKGIIAMAENDDKKKLKRDIDKALKTFVARPDYFLEFTFRGKKILFWNALSLNKEYFSKNIMKTEFYKSLNF